MKQPSSRLALTLRALECTVLFVAFPLFATIFRDGFRLIRALVLFGIFCVFILALSPSFDRRKLGHVGSFMRPMRLILVRFAVFGLLLLALTWLHDQVNANGTALGLPISNRDLLFGFLSREPRTYLIVMAFYPLLSAYPQELIYRAFFFHRYECLIRDPRAMVIASAAAFAFAHIIMLNWVAVAFSFVAGLIFADTYRRSRSLVLPFIEHSLYGDLVFTLGLGWYFYTGAI